MSCVLALPLPGLCLTLCSKPPFSAFTWPDLAHWGEWLDIWKPVSLGLGPKTPVSALKKRNLNGMASDNWAFLPDSKYALPGRSAWSTLPFLESFSRFWSLYPMTHGWFLPHTRIRFWVMSVKWQTLNTAINLSSTGFPICQWWSHWGWINIFLVKFNPILQKTRQH
jgi:hypothetical protein